MGPDVLAEIRSEATKDGLVLRFHANGFEAQKFAADGNVDLIAHGWHWGDLDKRTELPDASSAYSIRSVEKKIDYQPTVAQVLCSQDFDL
ncbi:MAG TPA: hypothetical protein VIX37_15750 [Candidatus Sulfotelmatobacter sp.]